jgi:hypothetical protein
MGLGDPSSSPEENERLNKHGMSGVSLQGHPGAVMEVNEMTGLRKLVEVDHWSNLGWLFPGPDDPEALMQMLPACLYVVHHPKMAMISGSSAPAFLSDIVEMVEKAGVKVYYKKSDKSVHQITRARDELPSMAVAMTDTNQQATFKDIAKKLDYQHIWCSNEDAYWSKSHASLMMKEIILNVVPKSKSALDQACYLRQMLVAHTCQQCSAYISLSENALKNFAQMNNQVEFFSNEGLLPLCALHRDRPCDVEPLNYVCYGKDELKKIEAQCKFVIDRLFQRIDVTPLLGAACLETKFQTYKMKVPGVNKGPAIWSCYGALGPEPDAPLLIRAERVKDSMIHISNLESVNAPFRWQAMATKMDPETIQYFALTLYFKLKHLEPYLESFREDGSLRNESVIPFCSCDRHPYLISRPLTKRVLYRDQYRHTFVMRDLRQYPHFWIDHGDLLQEAIECFPIRS